MRVNEANNESPTTYVVYSVLLPCSNAHQSPVRPQREPSREDCYRSIDQSLS